VFCDCGGFLCNDFILTSYSIFGSVLEAIGGAGQTLAVLGGCFVSSQGEMVGSSLGPGMVKYIDFIDTYFYF
jgi:hypothetical protein